VIDVELSKQPVAPPPSVTIPPLRLVAAPLPSSYASGADDHRRKSGLPGASHFGAIPDFTIGAPVQHASSKPDRTTSLPLVGMPLQWNAPHLSTTECLIPGQALLQVVSTRISASDLSMVAQVPWETVRLEPNHRESMQTPSRRAFPRWKTDDEVRMVPTPLPPYQSNRDQRGRWIVVPPTTSQTSSRKVFVLQPPSRVRHRNSSGHDSGDVDMTVAVPNPSFAFLGMVSVVGWPHHFDQMSVRSV
jgi:hypothetical protein